MQPIPLPPPPPIPVSQPDSQPAENEPPEDFMNGVSTLAPLGVDRPNKYRSGWQLPAGVALQLFRVQGGARSAIGYVFFPFSSSRCPPEWMRPLLEAAKLFAIRVVSIRFQILRLTFNLSDAPRRSRCFRPVRFAGIQLGSFSVILA